MKLNKQQRLNVSNVKDKHQVLAYHPNRKNNLNIQTLVKERWQVSEPGNILTNTCNKINQPQLYSQGKDLEFNRLSVMMMILLPVCDSKLPVLQLTVQHTHNTEHRWRWRGRGVETDVTLAPPVSVNQVLHDGPPQSCSLIGSQRFGQAGHFLQTLVVGVLVVVVRFDQDHAGRPLGARRRSQILEAEQKRMMDQLSVTTVDAGVVFLQALTVRLRKHRKLLLRGARSPRPIGEQTHHFGGDVGVRQVPVFTHDGQVTVDVDGQRVSGQDHDAAQTPGGALGLY